MSRRTRSACAGGSQPLFQIGIVLDRMDDADRHGLRPPASIRDVPWAELGAAHTPPDLDPVVVAVRGIHTWQHDRAELLRRLDEVGAVELQRRARRA